MSTLRWRLIANFIPGDPYYNLAVEEALNKSENPVPTLRIWVNKPAVVLGRFSRTEEDVNIEYCIDNNIAIVRRHTGGGTVYHDEWNLNITLLYPYSKINDIYECYSTLGEIVTSTLLLMGLNPVYNQTEVLVHDKKIAGMAASRSRYSVICHSTLLVASDLNSLRKALKKMKRDVTTITAETGRHYKLEDVYTALMRAFVYVTGSGEVVKGELTEEESRIARELYTRKYLRDSWNFEL